MARGGTRQVMRAMLAVRSVAAVLSIAPCVLAQAIYIPNYTTSNIAAYLVAPASGMLSPVVGSPFVTGTSPIQALAHPSGRFLYVLDAGSGDISLYSISAPSGTLSFIACPLCAAVSPSGMAIDPLGQFLFVTNSVPGTVTPYRINITTGTLTMSPPVSTGTGSFPLQPVIDPTGRYLYVPDSATGKVSGFIINGGSLTPISGSPFPAGSGPQSIAASRNAVFVANQYSADISSYQIGPGGTLMATGPPVPAGGSPVSIAVDPSGNYVYLANQVQLVAFSAIPSGPYALTRVRSYDAGIMPCAVAVDPSGNYVYATSASSNDVSGFTTSAAGTLISIGRFSTFGAVGPRLFAVHHIGDTTAISLTPFPVAQAAYGTPVELRGTVGNTSNPGTTPRGSVIITVNGKAVPNGSVALDSSGGFELIFDGSRQFLPVGSNVIQIDYIPSAGFEAPAPSFVTYTVTKATPVFNVTYSPLPPIADQPMTITVSSMRVGACYPSGSVTFTVDGRNSGTAVTLTNGSASTSYTPATGEHSLVFSYDGDNYFAALRTTPVSFHARHVTTVTVASNVTSLVYFQAPTLVATVSAGGGAISGTVDFYDGGTRIGAAPVVQSGASYIAQLSTFSFLSLGQHSITATYSGDADNIGSNSNAAPVILKVAPNAVDVSTPLVSGTGVYGQPLTVTATATAAFPGGGIPTGAMAFKDGNTPLGTVVLASGSASLSISRLAAGFHTITAAYEGDAKFLAANSAGVQVAIAAATPSVNVTVTPGTTVVYGQPVTLTATLSGTTKAGGTIDFSVADARIGSVSVNGTKATLAYTPLAVVSNTITATYNGDANNHAASSSTMLIVNQASTTVSTPSISGSAALGQSITLTALVSPVAPGSGAPSGVVTFRDGATALGTAELVASNASLATAALTPGAHSITAAYLGDANFTTGTSAPATVTVARYTPIVQVSVDPSSPVSGQLVTLRATVSGVRDIPCAGDVDFLDNGVKLNSTSIVLSSGQVQLSYAAGSAGAHTLISSYSGDANCSPTGNNASPLNLKVSQAAVTLSAPAISGTPTYHQPLAVTATIAAAPPGSGAPSGNMTFKDGTTILGMAAITNGVATLTTSAVAAGSRMITAVYSGDTNFLLGVSAATSLGVSKATGSLSLSSTPASGFVSGQAISLTSVVDGGTASGSMDFFDGGTRINSTPISVESGRAQVSWIVTGVGLHVISAVYSGDANYSPSNSSTGPLSLQVGQAFTTVGVPTYSGITKFGQPLTLTAVVSALAPAGGVPTGAVLFRDAGALVGLVTLSGGVAQLTTSTLSAGPHTIVAAYTGDGNCMSSSSPALIFTVEKAATSVSFSVSQTFHSTLLQATISGLGRGTPTGTVQFLQGATFLGAVPMNSGFASLELGVIAGSITAVYSGDNNFFGSTATTSVGSNPNPAVALSLKINPNPAIAGQTITFTVNFAGNGRMVPGGKIQLYDSATLIGSSAAVGQVNLTAAFNAGNHNILVAYSGDGTYPASSASAKLTVNKNPGATLSLAADGNLLVFGQTLHLVATAGPAAAQAFAPTGQIRFLEQSTSLGSELLTGGRAALVLSSLVPGVHQIVAVYDGDANWSPATSNVISISVAKGVTTLSISIAFEDAASNQATVTATVAIMPPGHGVATGNARFVDISTGQIVGTAPLIDGSAKASIPIPDDSATIVGAYDGDACLLATASVPLLRFAIVNSASNRSSALAPDELATVFSSGLANETITAELPLPEALGDVTVVLTDRTGVSRAAPLLYVSPDQLNFLVPSDAALGPATLTINTAGSPPLTAAVIVGPASPALFTASANGQGVPAAQVIRVHPDGTQEPPQNTARYDDASQTWTAQPIDLSSSSDQLYLILYGTGIRHESSSAAVTIGGQFFPVSYAGPQPSHPGLDQVNVLLSDTLKGTGPVEVLITTDGRQSNWATLYFE